jgi:hypothetical protein
MPIRYLQPGSGKARTGYLWVSDIPRGSVFFHWHPGRDASGLDTLFAREPVDNDTLAESQIDELVAIIQWPCLEASLTPAKLKKARGASAKIAWHHRTHRREGGDCHASARATTQPRRFGPRSVSGGLARRRCG